MQSGRIQLRLKPILRMLRMRVSRIFSERSSIVVVGSPKLPIRCKLVVAVPYVSCLPDSCAYTKEALMQLRKRGCELCLRLTQSAENFGCSDCRIRIEVDQMKEQESQTTLPAKST